MVLPSGLGYWTVVDEDFEPQAEVERYLRELRLARDRSEKTTGQYASGLATFMNWAVDTGLGLDWETCAERLAWFVLHLRSTPIQRRGRSHGSARSTDRINDILTAVRGFFRHLMREGQVSADVAVRLYDIVEPTHGTHAWMEHLPATVLKPLHGLPRSGISDPEHVTLEEFVAMLGVRAPLRDKALLCALGLAGLRVGQAIGVHRSDLHLMENSRAVGCQRAGPHIHVKRREDNTNAALSKTRREVIVPAHPWFIAAYSAYMQEREKILAAAASDYAFVNLGGGAIGAAMSYHRAHEVIGSMGRRAGIARVVTPHQLRHGLGTALANSGRPVDEIQLILGHSSPETTRRYMRTSDQRVRDAIESVPLPSERPLA